MKWSLKKLFAWRKWFRPAPARRPRRDRRLQLQMESLEDRNLPSLVPLLGFTPAQISHAYGFDQIFFKGASGSNIRGDGTGQTIAIIGQLDDPYITQDVSVFDQKFGIPDFNQPNGPQLAVDWVGRPNGAAPPPTADIGNIDEMSMDVEWAHAMAPGANIVLVEAMSASNEDFFGAVRYAKQIIDPEGNHPSVISMSYGSELDPTGSTENSFNSVLTGQGIVFVAASGDNAKPLYPASAPTVIAVGGTSLGILDRQGNYGGESFWTLSGSGPDTNVPEPAYQYAVQSSGNRWTADVAYNADPNPGFQVYDSAHLFPPFEDSWFDQGGTSAGAPQWAALMAIADQGLVLNNEPSLASADALTELYHLPATDFHKITGANWYAGTGLGSPYADRIVRDLVYDDQPQLTTVPASVVEGDDSQALTLARFTVSDPDVNPEDPNNGYTATITWGDGMSSPGTIYPDNGAFIIQGKHKYLNQGSYVASVTLTGPSPNVFPPIFSLTNITVTDPLPVVSAQPFTAAEGVAFKGVVATFTSSDPGASISDFHGTINWGDNTTSAASNIILQNGVYQVYGDHTYTDELQVGIATITVSDNDGGSASDFEIINVADAAIKVNPVAFGPTEGVPFHGVVATITDPNPGATIWDYSATIDWGDTTPSSPATAIVPDPQQPGVFDVIGDHTYKEEQFSASVTITVTDDGGSHDSGNINISVPDATLQADPIAIQSYEGHPYSGVVASFRDYDTLATPADFTATIQWGDGATTGTINYDTTLGKFDVIGSHDYGNREEGSVPISVIITDVDGGQTTTANGQLQIVDAPLTATRVAINPVEGQFFQGVVASFTDSDPYGQLSDYSAKAGINWGDGFITDGTISTNGNGVYYVSGSHTYTDEGLYQVKVTVADVGGASATVDDGFEPLATTGGLSKPQGLAAGDFNRDGKNDLVVAQQVSSLIGHNTVNRVTVLLGNGDATFQTGWSTDLTGSGFVSVAAADLTGNGILDLVVSEEGTYNPTTASYIGGSVMVFLGNVDGTFRAGPSYADPAGPVAVALGDINGDGRADLAVADAGSYNLASHSFAGAIRVLTGNGDGTFRSWVTLADNQSPIALAVGDVNADHRADLVVADAGTYNTITRTVTNGRVRVLLNQGGGTFLPGWSVSTIQTGSVNPGHVSLVLADFYHHGKLDLAVAKQGAGTLTVFAGKGDGTFQAFVSRGNIASPSALAAGDFNGDGKLDLAIANFVPGTVTVWTNTLTAVADAPVTGSGVNVAAVAGQAFTGAVAQFTDANPLAVAADFTVTIDWSDGPPTSGTLVAGGGGAFYIQGTHTYASRGSYRITIRITDKGGSWLDLFSQALVN
jgi:hypothetical protein